MSFSNNFLFPSTERTATLREFCELTGLAGDVFFSDTGFLVGQSFLFLPCLWSVVLSTPSLESLGESSLGFELGTRSSTVCNSVEDRSFSAVRKFNLITLSLPKVLKLKLNDEIVS